MVALFRDLREAARRPVHSDSKLVHLPRHESPRAHSAAPVFPHRTNAQTGLRDTPCLLELGCGKIRKDLIEG